MEVDQDIILLFRPDAVVRERATGDIYVVSWKTASMYGKFTTEQAKIDMQSMSEVFGVEQTSKHKIEGVIYKYLLKGQRRLDKWDNIYKQSSHLIYGWCKAIPGEEGFDWSWAFEYENETDSTKTSKLGKGWAKKPIWSSYPGGVKAWIEALSRNEIFPRHGEHPLAKVFPVSLPVERRADEIERWRRQVVAQEQRIQMAIEAIESVPEEIHADLLDVHFPQYTHSCFSFARKCSFFEICHAPSVGADPMGSGLYVPRQSNHPEAGGDDE